MMSVIALVAVVFTLSFVAPAAAGPDSAVSSLATGRTALDRKLDEYIRAQMRAQQIVGLSLAVIKDGKVIKAKGYGLANIETHTLATANTSYKIGSISKQFLAAGIMLLVKEGKVALDDPVSKYLEDAPGTWKDTKVRHLLTHTSGLAEQRPVDDPPGFEPFKSQPDIDTIRKAYPLSLQFAPGDKWSYSNLGYFVVAEIIRTASGQPWSDFLASRVLVPAGMTSTRTTSTTDIIPGRSGGYEIKDGKLRNAENWIAIRPSGAFVSTVLDMAKWDAALYSDAVLSSSMREQMWTPTTLSDGTSVPYGMGWGLRLWNNGRLVEHDGGLPGFVSDFERFVDAGLSVIVLMNTTSGNPGGMALHVAGLYDPKLSLRPTPDGAADVTARLRGVLEQVTDGTVQSDVVTQQYAAEAFPDRMRRTGEYLRSLGPRTSMTLVESSQWNGQWSRHYRITYKDRTLVWQVTVTADRKVAEMQFGPDY
jgi:D-alanyl-D-alanine carboxypeptidase